VIKPVWGNTANLRPIGGICASFGHKQKGQSPTSWRHTRPNRDAFFPGSINPELPISSPLLRQLSKPVWPNR
jgi:hypothetical protein